MTKKILLSLVLVAVGFTMAPPARSQEILLEGPLANAPAVRRLVLYREGRFFLTPTITFTLIDTYRRHMLFGAKGEYNIFDWLSAGFWFAGGFGWRTGISDQINDLGVDHVPGRDRDSYDLNFPRQGGIDSQLGQMPFIGAIEGRVIPFRGKFSLFGKLALAMDMYAFLGVGIAGVQERGDVDCALIDRDGNPATLERGPSCPSATNGTLNTYGDMKLRVAVGPTFGGGVTVFFNDWIGLNLEYRATPFTWNQSGTDEYGEDEVRLDDRINEDDRSLHWNNMFTLGCTFAFPLTATRTE